MQIQQVGQAILVSAEQNRVNLNEVLREESQEIWVKSRHSSFFNLEVVNQVLDILLSEVFDGFDS